MSRYYYEFEQDNIYCYPDSFILKNKLNIRDQNKLEEAERNITALRILELKKQPLTGPLNFRYLCKLHKYIFGDIYSWAGKIRSVNITKGTMFCDCKFIQQAADDLFTQLKNEQYLKNCNAEEIPLKLAYYLSEINALHPFRDGNGRMGRMWQTLLLYQWKSIFGWLPIETLIRARQQEYYSALGQADRKADSGVFIEFLLERIYDSLKEQQQTEQVNSQVTEQVRRLLDVLENKELSTKELMETLGLKHRPTFRDNYLLPAMKLGLVEMTIPEKPNSNKQKYKNAKK